MNPTNKSESIQCGLRPQQNLHSCCLKQDIHPFPSVIFCISCNNHRELKISTKEQCMKLKISFSIAPIIDSNLLGDQTLFLQCNIMQVHMLELCHCYKLLHVAQSISTEMNKC